MFRTNQGSLRTSPGCFRTNPASLRTNPDCFRTNLGWFKTRPGCLGQTLTVLGHIQLVSGQSQAV